MGLETAWWFLEAAATRGVLRRNREGKAIRKFVVLQQSKLGDMVCTTPVFRAIKEKFKEAEVHVFGRGSNREILAGNPNVDVFLPREERGLSGWIEYFRKQEYDFGISTSPDTFASVLLLAGGVGRVALPVVRGGRASGETISYRIFRCLAETSVYSIGAYAPREMLRLLEPVGIVSEDTRKEAYVNAESLASVARLFPESSKNIDRKKIGLIVGAGNVLKCWPESHMAEFAREITCSVSCDIFLIGSASEKQKAKEVKRLAGLDVIDTVGSLSLRELVALISEMDLVVGVDTGPIYIAEALDIPTIDITGPVDEKEQPPIGPSHVVLYGDVPCRPCSRVQNTATHCRIGERLCLTRVEPSSVARAARALLNV